MTQRNVRGAYVTFEHDRAADWDWLAKWQPNVIRYMAPANHNDPNSFGVQRVKRIHETCPDARILLRCWDVDDRNFEAHDAMVADPIAEAERQVDWWAKVFDRVVVAGVPRNLLMAGLNNETGPEKDAALYDYTEAALKFGIQKNVRLGVFVFSVGRPSLKGESDYDIPRFSRLEPLILANGGAIVLHSYMQPEGMYAVWTDEQGNERKDWTYLMGRDLRWLTNVPIIIGEWGIDGLLYNRHPDPKYGNSGWTNFKEWPPSRYADEYVECIRQANPNVIAICPFISDWSDHKWQSFDLIGAYGEFLARKDKCVRDDAAPTPPASTPMWVNVPAGARLRGAPNTSAPILDNIPFAEQVNATGMTELTAGAQWTEVIASNGKQGWILGSLLSPTAPSNPGPTPPVQPPTQPAGDCWTRAREFVRRWEGGWADNPADPGGATMKGITIGTYKRWREAHGQPEPTKDDLRNIPDAETDQIFHDWYWLASGADKLPWPLCLAHFDTAVNAGTGRAQEMLAKSNGNFLAYLGHLLTWYASIDGFETFGRGWIRRRADLLVEASKP